MQTNSESLQYASGISAAEMDPHPLVQIQINHRIFFHILSNWGGF